MYKYAALIRRLLGERRVRAFRNPWRRLRFVLLLIMERVPFLAKFYVLFFSAAYDREIRSVISGQVAHVKNKQGREAANYHLRRCIHRLEKGLSMRPLRRVFGLDIICPTLLSYERTLQAGMAGAAELKWAHDVLSEYFDVCESHPVIDEARERFNGIDRPKKIAVGTRLVPYCRGASPQLTVTYPQLFELARRRRSVRWYRQVSVERGLIDKAVELAALSPSACNRQPFIFRVIDDPALLAKCRLLPMGVRGFSDNIPVLIAVVGQLRAYPEARDRHVIYIDGALAAMSFMYAAETLGLATCAINWPDVDARERKAAEVLGLEQDQRIVMWLALGYPDDEGKVPFSAKIDLESIRTFN